MSISHTVHNGLLAYTVYKIATRRSCRPRWAKSELQYQIEGFLWALGTIWLLGYLTIHMLPPALMRQF